VAAITVHADDADVRSWIAAWLAEGRLAPSAPLEMHITVVTALSPPDDPRAPFPQPDLEIRAGAPLTHTEVRWLAAPALARIGASRADVVLTPAALARREPLAQSFLTAVLVFLLRRAGWHHVHAATAVDPRGRGWLLAGNARDGKSTTAARLATLGWAVGGDDLTFLAEDADGVVALPRRASIALREDGLRLLRRGGGRPVREGRKSAFTPEELGGRWAARVRPDIVAFPRIAGTRTRAEPLAPAEALARLVRWSAWVLLEPDLAQPHLDLLARLTRQARCVTLDLAPDLFDDADRLMEVVS